LIADDCRHALLDFHAIDTMPLLPRAALDSYACYAFILIFHDAVAIFTLSLILL